MKAKWYLSTLLIILTLLGVSQQQIALPNQEIVVHFNKVEVTYNESQNAIQVVKNKLRSIGVENIKVTEGSDGILKISYYSELDVDSIKSILSKEKTLELGYTSYKKEEENSKLPYEDNSNPYNFDVYEIHSNDDTQSDLDGFVLQLKSDSDRFSNPNVYLSANVTGLKERNQIEEVAYITNRTVAIAIDDTSYGIPEVRAGPESGNNLTF